MRKKAVFLFAILLGIPLFNPDPCCPEQAQHKSLTVLFGDSVNGTIEPCPGCEGGSQLGGLARRGAWVQSARETQKESLLLDSGDLFFDRYRKTIPAEDITALSEKALLILKCYNLLGWLHLRKEVIGRRFDESYLRHQYWFCYKPFPGTG